MTVLQRIPTAVRYLFSGKSAYDVLPIGIAGEPSYDSAGFYNNVTKRFRKNELIYACTMYKADSMASAKLQVYQDGKDDELDNHPIRTLFEQPNPFLTEFDLFALIMIIMPSSANSSRARNSPLNSCRSIRYWREYTSAAPTAM